MTTVLARRCASTADDLTRGPDEANPLRGPPAEQRAVVAEVIPEPWVEAVVVERAHTGARTLVVDLAPAEAHRLGPSAPTCWFTDPNGVSHRHVSSGSPGSDDWTSPAGRPLTSTDDGASSHYATHCHRRVTGRVKPRVRTPVTCTYRGS